MSGVYTSFEAKFTARMQEKQNILLNAIGDGQAQDYPAYREVCGKLMGLREGHDEAMAIIEELKK